MNAYIAKAPYEVEDRQLTLTDLLLLLRAGKRAEWKESLGEAYNLKTCSQVLCMDCMEWLESQPKDSIPCIVTDPPYGCYKIWYGWREPGHDAESFWRWFQPYWQEMKRILQPGGLIFINQAAKYLDKFWLWYGCKAKIVALSRIAHQMCFWQAGVLYQKPGGKLLRRITTSTPMIGPDQWSEWTGNNPVGEAVRIIKFLMPEGAPIIDPFCGTGNYLVAAKTLGLGYLGIDRAEEACKIANKRLTETAVP